MPGLLEQAQAQAPEGQEAAPQEDAPQPGAQPGQQANPADVQRIVIAAKKVLAQPEVAKGLVQMMQSAQDPAQGIAKALIFLMQQLFEKSRGTIPPKAVVPAAQEIIVDVAKLGAAAGLFKLSKELVMQAAKIAIQQFLATAKKPEQAAPDEAEPQEETDPEAETMEE